MILEYCTILHQISKAITSRNRRSTAKPVDYRQAGGFRIYKKRNQASAIIFHTEELCDY
jgi:hypothetical protein